MNAAEFYQLGLGDPITVSAINGPEPATLDLLVAKFDKTSPVERELEDLPCLPWWAVPMPENLP